MRTFKQLPVLPGAPLIGSILEYRRDFLGLLRHMAELGDLSSCVIMGQRIALVNHPDLLKELLVTHGHKLNKSRDSLDASVPLAGHGLFNIDEKYHTQDRKLLAADFTPSAVAHYSDLILDCTDDQLADFKSGDSMQLGKAMVQLTVRIIGKIALGVDLLSESESLWRTFTVAFERMREYMAEIIPLPLSFPTPSHLAYKQAVADLDALVYRIIDEHRRGDNQSEDVVNRLLRIQADKSSGDLEMTDQQIRDEVVTMLVAGHETTANALSFAFAELALNRPLYDRAQAQVDEVLGGRRPTAEDLARLPLVGAIFHESLRKYPPFYVLDRQNFEEITVGDCLFPKDSTILFSPYTMHRRPDLFPDPERFDPDRFTPEKMKSMNKFGFIPFSAGHRICLGKHLAILEGSLILTRYLQKVNFTSQHAEPPRPEPLVTLRPDPSYHLKMEPRSI